MKFSIRTLFLFALTGCALLAVVSNADQDANAAPPAEMTPEEVGQMLNDTITDIIDAVDAAPPAEMTPDDVGQMLNDTITDVMDAVANSTLGQFLQCWGDGDALRQDADLKAAEDAYYASALYSDKISSETATDGSSTSTEIYTLTVGADELAAYEAACKAVDGSVWVGADSWTGQCIDDGTTITLETPNGWGVCYPDTDECNGFNDWYTTAWENFFTVLSDEGVQCSGDPLPSDSASNAKTNLLSFVVLTIAAVVAIVV